MEKTQKLFSKLVENESKIAKRCIKHKVSREELIEVVERFLRTSAAKKICDSSKKKA